jgi:hypothetical protein
MLPFVSRKYSDVWTIRPQGIPLAFFLKLSQIGSFWTSRHFSTDSSPMLDLITCTCSRGTPTSTRIIIQVNYNEYIIQRFTPISINKLELIKYVGNSWSMPIKCRIWWVFNVQTKLVHLLTLFFIWNTMGILFTFRWIMLNYIYFT